MKRLNVCRLYPSQYNYATRNEIVHADLMILIKNGRFQTLQKHLYNDYCDIPRVVPAVKGLETKLMSKILLHMVDCWFVRSEDDPDNKEMWTPTEEIKACYKCLRNTKNEGETAKRIIQEINLSLAKKIKSEKQDKDFMEFAESDFEITPSTQTAKQATKRVASMDLQSEVKKAKTMATEWKRLLNMATGIRTLSETYVQKYGVLAGPPNIVYDRTLDL
ncbi:MAG: hypothetical protein M1834_006288 [Cirrosporium novae-zelandiae]|nr:MAG: hypothetical protein M1834_006288 [Cirrosporium novae-zelandiae]